MKDTTRLQEIIYRGRFRNRARRAAPDAATARSGGTGARVKTPKRVLGALEKWGGEIGVAASGWEMANRLGR